MRTRIQVVELESRTKCYWAFIWYYGRLYWTLQNFDWTTRHLIGWTLSDFAKAGTPKLIMITC